MLKRLGLLAAVTGLCVLSSPAVAAAEPLEVAVSTSPDGMKLAVDGQETLVRGVTWEYADRTIDFWAQDEAVIRGVLDSQMSLLKSMGVNAIRSRAAISPHWVTYIHDRYGIMTAIHHPLGRGGLVVNGASLSEPNYGDPATRKALLADVKRVVERFRDTRGVLMYVLGDANNDTLAPDAAADPLYSLWCEAATVVSQAASGQPVAIAHGGLQHLDLVAKHCKDLDIFGTDARSATPEDFQRVRDTLGLPIMLTGPAPEQGSLDEAAYAEALKERWRVVYKQSRGKGGAGSAIGGFAADLARLSSTPGATHEASSPGLSYFVLREVFGSSTQLESADAAAVDARFDAIVVPTTETPELAAEVADRRVAKAAQVAPTLVASPKRPAGANHVEVFKSPEGMKLVVDGRPMMVFGMNWEYVPIGQNYAYDFWGQDDAFIKRVLDAEMGLMQEMGVNVIRMFSMIPPKWVTYIYDNFGIMTAVNHLLGRYGFEVNGAMVAQTNYGDRATRKAILEDVQRTVERYRDTRGVVMFLLGNENNYGLQWTSFEIEDVPEEVEDPRAEQLYSLWCEAASVVSQGTDDHPVAIVNGDLQYLDLVARYCKDLDILGTNMYRGVSAGDAFQRVHDELGLPFLYTEFGSDAFNARTQKEDDLMQARYLKGQWHEIYRQSYGKGAVGNAIGGMVFQWADGWWKYKQEENLDVHDRNASWATGAFDDYEEGRNNMNEEWWGIAAKNPSDSSGFYTVTPRTAYYVLREAFRLDPYAQLPDVASVDAHFNAISIADLSTRYLAARSAEEVDRLRSIRMSGLSLRFDSSVSRGDEHTARGDRIASGHTESFVAEITLEEGSVASGRLAIHGVGNVAQNRLDDIFYEQRALAAAEDGGVVDEAADIVDRFGIYQADFQIRQPLFELDGFYRVGHQGWGYEGDFFNLYPEAYYGENLDIYNGLAPLGMQFTGKRQLDGLKVAAGPELWWGANPAAIAKYYKDHGRLRYALIHHEDLTQRSETTSSFAVPAQLNRRSSLHLGARLGKWDLEVGGLWSGTPRIGDRFVYTRKTDGASYADSGYEVFEDEIELADTFGGRARATLSLPGFLWYGQGSLMGLVADGGYNYTDVVTGWELKESGRGNHWGVSSGLSARLGHFEIAPKALYQRPLIEANPTIADEFVEGPDLYFPPVRPRNVLDDPFTVLENRETLAGELLLVWDPTPGTWWHRWDRESGENAPFGMSLDIWYQHLPGLRDSHVFTLDGGEVVAFPFAPAEGADEWLATLTGINTFNARTRLATSVFVGRRQPRSEQVRADDDLSVGAHARFWWNNIHVKSRAAFNDWGPFDFHRDFNLIYPFQAYLDASWGTRPVGQEVRGTRIGARAQVRTLDDRSLDYVAATDGTAPVGVEWEAGIYANIELGGAKP